jgi:hypothetical protein
MYSAIPVAILQGSVTVLANFIKPIITESALANLSMIGSILIFCVGLNLVWGRKIRVANLLPAIILAAYAQTKVNTTYTRYSKMIAKSGMTGAEVARLLLDISCGSTGHLCALILLDMV